MRILKPAALLAAGMLAGCMAGGPVTTAQSPPAEPRSPLGSPFRDNYGRGGGAGTPLVIDRTDLAPGTTVQFARLPTAAEINDLSQMSRQAYAMGLAHVVLALPAWPRDYEALAVLSQLPEQADVIVVLPGYPPSREAAEAWNYVGARLRLVLVVAGPPSDRGVLQDLNTMRSLERVIAQMDEPSRAGFERLQRPLSFRKVVE
ncbi:MAG: hypothetical protein HZC42_09990 [Candidatus Eisenbacteria bacterium]|nr:hypothetical protein [Candidatus Eisenbacteria bacterium]